jgi:L-lactate dehydrogenase complex protein LldG
MKKQSKTPYVVSYDCKMNEKEKILGRIREALTLAAPIPGPHDKEARPSTTGHPIQNARRWLPAVGATSEQHIALFRTNALELKADFYLLNDLEELKSRLRELSRAENWNRIASHNGELARVACEAVGLPVCRTDEPYDVNALELCDAGFTECDALIAQTGSVLVTSVSAGGRALSVLPPHHVVLARREQMLPDLTAAFDLLKRKYAENYPSFISFITGPSRTGDIERILVLGAHGPKKLTILCI